jgi:protein involved in polysaccharide export with SLBB domain
MIRHAFARLFRGGWLLLALAGLAGCATTDTTPGGPKPASPVAAPAGEMPPNIDNLRIGDHVRVEFSGAAVKIEPVVTAVRDDGTITLPLVTDPIKAVGLNPRQLEANIATNYVPNLFPKLTITVTPEDRYFVVGGQVKSPNSYKYSSGMTVTKAIETAGSYTDFANKKKVRLRRAGATKDIIVNGIKATANPEFDKFVFPGDEIIVPRILDLHPFQ